MSRPSLKGDEVAKGEGVVKERVVVCGASGVRRKGVRRGGVRKKSCAERVVLCVGEEVLHGKEG